MELYQTFCFESKSNFNWVMTSSCVLSVFATIYLLRESVRKIKRITEPYDDVPWDQMKGTYCILSLYLVRIVQLLLIL